MLRKQLSVMRGFDPRISRREAPCPPDRDGRDEPGRDDGESSWSTAICPQDYAMEEGQGRSYSAATGISTGRGE
jgi:hypothetical protein